MCRLLGYVAATSTPITSSLGEASFADFTSLCALHGDGWGMAWRDGDRIETAKSPVSALESPEFADLAGRALSSAGLVHLRWATNGLAVEPVNTHPFTASLHGVDWTLAHNGSITPVSAFDELLTDESHAALLGTTDSERYFRYVLHEIALGGDPMDAVCTAVGQLRTLFPTHSLNALIMSSTHLYAVHVNEGASSPVNEVLEATSAGGFEIPRGHGSSGGYFTMFYRESADAVHVVSSGIDPSGWTPIPADSVMAIDLATRAFQFRALPD